MADQIIFHSKPGINHFIRNIPLLISGAALSVLIFLPAFGIWQPLVIALPLLLVLAAHMSNVHTLWKSHVRLDHALMAIVILLIEVSPFFHAGCAQKVGNGIAALASLSEESSHQMLTSVAIACSIAGFYFLCGLIAFIEAQCERSGKKSNASSLSPSHSESKGIRFILWGAIVICFLLMLLASFSPHMWWDTAVSQNLAFRSPSEMGRFILDDVHPPLYYLILTIAERTVSLLSDDLLIRIATGKILSTLAYALTAALCWKKLRAEKRSPYVVELAILCLFAIPQTMNNGVETRMYAWALFFVTGTYLYARDIIMGTNSTKSWILYTFFSLGCSYTHNFALIAMAVIWLSLFFWSLRKNRAQLKAVLISGVIVAILYLPWFLILIKQTLRVKSGFWIPAVEWFDIGSFIYNIMPGGLIFVFLTAVYYAKHQWKEEALIKVDSLGILITFSTLVITFIFSLLVAPILTPKYMLPCSFCLWVSVVLLLSRMRGKWLVVMTLLIIGGGGASCYHFSMEQAMHTKTSQKAFQIISSFEDDSVIYINGGDEPASVIQCYTKCEIHQKKQHNDVNLIKKLLESGKTVYFLTATSIPKPLSQVNRTHIGNIEVAGVFGVSGKHKSHHFAVFRLSI